MKPYAAVLMSVCALFAGCAGANFPAAPSNPQSIVFSGASSAGAVTARAMAVTARATAAPAPTNLTATVSFRTVSLTWTASPGATSYIVQAGTSPGLSNAAIQPVGSVTTISATNVDPGTYYVRVVAQDASGISAPSNEVIVTVASTGCTTAPGAPTGLTGSVNGSTVFLSWSAPAGGCAVKQYRLLAGSRSGASDVCCTDGSGNTATSVSAPGVPAGTYYVRVAASNDFGTGPASNEVVVTVGSTGTTLTGLSGNWSTALYSPGDSGDPHPQLLAMTQAGNTLTGSPLSPVGNARGTLTITLTGTTASVNLSWPAGSSASAPSCSVLGTGTGTASATSIRATITLRFTSCQALVGSMTSDVQVLELTKR